MRPAPHVAMLAVAPALALALSLAAGAASAQTSAPPATPPATIAPASPSAAPATATAAPAAPKHVRTTLNERFAEANTTNDGHLTLAQAKAGLPTVARHFSAIDKDSKGYVTLDDIHTYQKAQRAMHQKAQPSTNG